jgi:chemotaxis protein CheC
VSHPELTEEHRDALQEVANIAMGEAGASLAELLGVFVRLSVPRIQTLDAAVVPQALAGLLGSGRMVTAVRQSFSSRVAGEAIVFFGEAGCAEIAGLMGYDQVLNAAERREVLLDITNVLVGACLGRIFQQFGIEPGFSPPSVLAEDVAVERLLHTDRLDWSHALLVEVNFSLEQSAFVSHLVMLLPELSIDNIRASLEQLIAAL